MKIELKKLNNDQHELRCTREDGSVEVAQLETKSFLVHDFTHWALESEAGLKESFWGLMAGGRTFESLREEFTYPTDELKLTEMLVGPLQGVVQERVSAEQYLSVLQNLFSAQNIKVPSWLTVDLVNQVKERYRRLIGEWRALPFGDSMEIAWDLLNNEGKVS